MENFLIVCLTFQQFCDNLQCVTCFLPRESMSAMLQTAEFKGKDRHALIESDNILFWIIHDLKNQQSLCYVQCVVKRHISVCLSKGIVLRFEPCPELCRAVKAFIREAYESIWTHNTNQLQIHRARCLQPFKPYCSFFMLVWGPAVKQQGWISTLISRFQCNSMLFLPKFCLVILISSTLNKWATLLFPLI